MSHSSKHHIEVSSVALVDLKAEISRRQIEVRQKAQTLPEGCTVIKNVCTSSSVEKRSIWRKSKPPVQPPEVLPLHDSIDSEEQKRLENVKKKLEAKSKLYEALKAAARSGTMSYSKRRLHPDENEDLLVDFEQKAEEEIRLRHPSPAHSISSVESQEIDQGSPHILNCDEHLENGDYVKRPCIQIDGENVKDTEPPLRGDGPLTYAHLREGEIRDHGVGFYAFSQDLEQREAEMARLRELHRATEEGRARAQAIRAKRDARMGQRLARLRARKGLPDVATVAAQCLAESSTPPTPLPVSADAQSDIRLSSDDLDVASMLRRLRDEAERRAAINNPVITPPCPALDQKFNLADVAAQNAMNTFGKYREWDRGKSMISAQRYIQEERERRNPEFAPPSSY